MTDLPQLTASAQDNRSIPTGLFVQTLNDTIDLQARRLAAFNNHVLEVVIWLLLGVAVAVATLWCHELGEHVLSEGEAVRREIDPGFERELSLFQLGLRWLQRCLSVTLARLPPFRAQLSPLKLSSVMKPAKS